MASAHMGPISSSSCNNWCLASSGHEQLYEELEWNRLLIDVAVGAFFRLIRLSTIQHFVILTINFVVFAEPCRVKIIIV